MRYGRKLILDGFQAGLSWRTILLKRDAFEGFIPARVAQYDATDIERLLGNPDIVRSRIKIRAAIKNANAYLSMQEWGEDFSSFVWDFVSNAAFRGDDTGRATRSVMGDRLSVELKK